MGNGWDFCSTKKEVILTACQGWTSQVKLTREIQVCEVSRDFTDKLRRNGGRCRMGECFEDGHFRIR
jgi:hypothetical protein